MQIWCYHILTVIIICTEHFAFQTQNTPQQHDAYSVIWLSLWVIFIYLHSCGFCKFSALTVFGTMEFGHDVEAILTSFYIWRKNYKPTILDAVWIGCGFEYTK